MERDEGDVTLTAPTAWVTLSPGTDAERAVPIEERLFVGRECAGVDPARRLIIDDPSVSRDHFELHAERGRAPRLLDLSANGTRVNGRRVERGVSIALMDGDLIELAGTQLRFHHDGFDSEARRVSDTILGFGIRTLALVVGDIVGYTAMTELHGADAVAKATESLFATLRGLVAEHGGTVANYVGDALFAVWDADEDDAAATRAVGFAVEAAGFVRSDSNVWLRAPDGVPPTMGWAITFGQAATARPAPGREAIHGDPVIIAFRLSGLAARAGRPVVLATEAIAQRAPTAANYAPLDEFAVKGRVAPVRVHGVRASAPEAGRMPPS